MSDLETVVSGGALLLFGLAWLAFMVMLVISPLCIWAHAKGARAEAAKVNRSMDALLGGVLPDLKRSIDAQTTALRGVAPPPEPTRPDIADCPQCGREIEVAAGGDGECPHCGAAYRFAGQEAA